MKKSNIVALILGLVAIILIAYIVISKEKNQIGKPATSKVKDVVISQAFQHLLYIGLYVAQDGGFFKEQNLNVKIETAGGDAQAFSALTSGNADFAQGDPGFVAISHEKGWEGRVIAMPVNRVAIWGVTFDTTIQKFSDPVGFKNMIVATYPEPNTSYVVQKELAIKSGLKIGEDVTILQVPFGTELSTLANNQANIAQTIEPNVTQVEQQGGKVVFSYPEAWGALAFTGLMTSKDLIDKDPTLVQQFVNAYEKALKFVHTNQDSTVNIAKRYLPNLDENTIRKALKRLTSSGCIPATTEVEPESWRKLLDIRVQVGDLSQIPSVNLIENKFSLNAKKNGK